MLQSFTLDILLPTNGDKYECNNMLMDATSLALLLRSSAWSNVECNKWKALLSALVGSGWGITGGFGKTYSKAWSPL